jgi:hypothetical protein
VEGGAFAPRSVPPIIARLPSQGRERTRGGRSTRRTAGRTTTAERGPRTGATAHPAPDDAWHACPVVRVTPDHRCDPAAGPAPDRSLLSVRDPAGRPRGTAFAADHDGTLLTAHETVAGLSRVVLHTADGRTHEVTADAVTPLPVPRHRIGPVVQALLLPGRRHRGHRLAAELGELVDALDAGPPSWWAARLLAEVLLGVPDATPCTTVLERLAGHIVARRRQRRPVPGEFAPAFWTALPLPHAGRLALLRTLVRADDAPYDTAAPRYLDAVAGLLAAEPTAVQPHLADWFDDDRPLPATPHATVAHAAQALLHTHRRRALDDLTEVLVAHPHPRAGELLAALAEEEPSAVCRAVDRWARDTRPERRAAAVTYGLRAAPWSGGPGHSPSASPRAPAAPTAHWPPRPATCQAPPRT